MRTRHFLSLFILGIILPALFLLTSCIDTYDESRTPPQKFRSKKVVIMVMDGARYTETWGDPHHYNIPYITKHIIPQSVVCENFYNDGPTYTIAGHSAITTGVYGEINNNGFEYPANPSIFQYFNKSTNIKGPQSYLITSKDKLSVLANCANATWHDKYLPAFNCGLDGSGVGSGYRNDSLTTAKAIEIMGLYHPRLVLINFLEPDGLGHTGDSMLYLQGIRRTDYYIYQVWKFLQQDKFYRDSTAIFITNDHGRHSPGVNGGFANHGDTCEGCRHIFLIASGPDFGKNVSVQDHYDLTDIAQTTARIMGFYFPVGRGDLMPELFHDRTLQAQDAGNEKK